MYKFLTKNGQPLAFSLGVLLCLLFIGIALSDIDSFNALSEADQKKADNFNVGLYMAIGLAVICGLLMVVFGLFQVLTNLKTSTKGLLGIVAMLAVFGIAYATSQPEGEGSPIYDTIQTFNVTDGQSKFISAAITTVGALSGFAIVAFIISELRNFFK